jgi:hypothetical protein
MASIRRVTAVVSFEGQDYENFGSNEYPAPINTSRTIILSDALPQNLVGFVSKWGGECRAEFNLLAQRLDNSDVHLRGVLKLFEGTSEDTDDLDGIREFEFICPRSATVPFEAFVRNDDEDDDDWARVHVLVTNNREVIDDD